jgi:hypothetical protein
MGPLRFARLFLGVTLKLGRFSSLLGGMQHEGLAFV